MMRSIWSWFVVSQLLALQALPATVEKQMIQHQIDDAGQVVERTELIVHLDSPDDLEHWSPYFIWLDSNRKLRWVSCSAVRPDGSEVKVSRRKQDRRQVTGGGALHSSKEKHEVVFPGTLPVGSRLHIRHEVEVQPYFPSGSILLTRDDSAIADLRVEVGGGGDRLRWHLEAESEADKQGIESTIEDGVLIINGSDLAASQEWTLLRYAWGPQTTWTDVGIWYEGLLQGIERASPRLQAQAELLIDGRTQPRQRLAQLLAFVRSDVRYVAVQVGIGGFRPSQPEDVLERRWGDCKDKSLLLIALLETAGIEAFPALIRSSLDRDVDHSFPVPDGFNHVIVAVPAEQLDSEPSDPVAGGYVLVDPTQTRGGLSWLHPGTQRKGALVVRAEHSAMIMTPDRSHLEGSQLKAELEPAPDGSASGTAELLIAGALASSLIDLLQTPSAEEAIATLLARHLPGARPTDLRWGSAEEPLPLVQIRVSVSFPSFFQESRLGPSLRLPDPMLVPSPSLLADDPSPAFHLGSAATHWVLHLPAGWCPAEVEEVAEQSLAGEYLQSASFADQALTVDRRVEIRAPAIDPENEEALRQLYLAEQRTKKRRLRFGCSADSPAEPHE